MDEDWPLTIVDFNSKSKKIILKPGQMVLYESAKAPHGRQFPLKGEFFDNVFVHYSPLKKWYTTEDFPAGTHIPNVKKKIELKDLKDKK